ncbi:MAG: DUF3267 domain-containing protein [Verrucomicrobiota bacterium]|jgi:hypothetical protein
MAEPTDKAAEIRLPKAKANLVGMGVSIALVIVCVLFVRMLPHYREDGPRQVLWFFAGLILMFPLHEGLHGAAALAWGKARIRDVKFGVDWKGLMPYCACKIPMTVFAYRRLLLLPLAGTGTLALLIALLVPTPLMAVLLAVSLSSAVGDVWIFLKMRAFPPDWIVIDDPSDIGCHVFRPSTTNASSALSA